MPAIKVAQAEQTDMQKLVCSKDWNCTIAMAIMMAESGGNCNAEHHNRNGSTDRGLFQINSIHTKKYINQNIYDCKTNLDVAYSIYKASGWSAWSSFNSGAYKKHL